MTSNAGIILLFCALFAWKFYQYRKAIWHNMNLYGEYLASYMKQKEDKIRKKRKSIRNR